MKSTMTELLEEYNDIAEDLGKNTLTSWKGSREDLTARIKKLRTEKYGTVDDGTITKRIQSKTPNVVVKSKMVSKEAEKIVNKTKEPKKVDSNTLTIADVAKLAGFDPKILRAKLRRLGKKANEGRWPTVVKDSKEHKELVALLKPKGEEK